MIEVGFDGDYKRLLMLNNLVGVKLKRETEYIDRLVVEEGCDIWLGLNGSGVKIKVYE